MTGSAPSRPLAIVVMGVSASGKSVVGSTLARALRIPFVDGDDLHPASNVDKMAAGNPLTDADREPWLAAVGSRLANEAVPGIVIACSALRRAYRDQLRSAAPDTVFVHLTGSPEMLAQRAASREGHFMPPELLASQLATLEPLGGDEAGVALDVSGPVDAICAAAATWIRSQNKGQ